MDEPQSIPMSQRKITRKKAALFTALPFLSGVMLSNLFGWSFVTLPRYMELDGDERFVVNVAFVATLLGVAGALHATFRFMRNPQLRQPGLWLLLATGCLSAKLPNSNLHVLPLSVNLLIRLDTAQVGVNALAVTLLIWYKWVVTGSNPLIKGVATQQDVKPFTPRPPSD